MTSQRIEDRTLEHEAARAGRMDRAARAIFPIFAALIIIATVAYVFGAARVEINPGKEAGYRNAASSSTQPGQAATVR